MNTFVLASTFFLTLLLLVGLFFFVKASVKDRTQQLKAIANQSDESLVEQLKQYFAQRAYRVAAVEQAQVTFEGQVRPSLGLAIFLSLLVAVGTLCLGLVVAILLPQVGAKALLLALSSPLAGWFYWQGAGRQEQVQLRVEPYGVQATQSLLTVTAHRDELAQLQRALQLTTLE